MDGKEVKYVMVIDEALPRGMIANTAAIMGITIGKRFPDGVGGDVYDRSGYRHLGIIETPVPILKGDGGSIKELREKLYRPEFAELTVVDFFDVAQGCKTYEEYTGKIANAPETALCYYGIAICGDKKQVNKLTGSLPLLR